jgi:hypothetical protein
MSWFPTTPSKGHRSSPGGKSPLSKYTPRRRTDQQGPKFDYELFNGNNFNIRYWSWNYRGCWPYYHTELSTYDSFPNHILLSSYLCIMGAPVIDTFSSGNSTSLEPTKSTGTFARVTTVLLLGLATGLS